MASGGEPRTNRGRWGIAALLLGTTCIALGVIAGKEAYGDGATPQDLLRARLLVAAAFIVPLLPWAIRSGERRRPGTLAVAIGAGVSLWLASRAEFEGLARLPAGMLVVVLATAPVWVAVLGWIGTGRAPTTLERVALTAVVGGIAIMAMPLGSSVDALGVLFGAASAICFAVFVLVMERNREVPAVTGFMLGMTGAAIALLATEPNAVGQLAGEDMSLPLILVLGASAAGWTFLVGLGLEATDSITTAVFVAIEPLLVSVLAFLILGEGLSLREIAGGSVVLLGLTASATQVSREDQ
jgi:drug/metabolite transporter (DMT)-like permease